jgi:hypothetical protein
MIEGSCHCGSVRIEIPRKPRHLTECNCSICRRYGTLWAYFNSKEVRIRGARDAKTSYLWGEGNIRFVRCRKCGCVTHWEAAKNPAGRRMGVNTRNLDPSAMKGVRIRHLDGASTWKFLD